jgi:hypothetical protein
MRASFPATCWALMDRARPRLELAPLGRRERRRRAKLRRRRARRRSGWTTIPMAPGMWRALALHWMFKRETLRFRDEMLFR